MCSLKKDSAFCAGLLAGSRYNVSVSAISGEGEGPPVSALLWTEVGTPRTPDTPTLVPHHAGGTRDGTIRVLLHPVESLEGPITAYQVLWTRIRIKILKSTSY
jgi:hypothetical protein